MYSVTGDYSKIESKPIINSKLAISSIISNSIEDDDKYLPISLHQIVKDSMFDLVKKIIENPLSREKKYKVIIIELLTSMNKAKTELEFGPDSCSEDFYKDHAIRLWDLASESFENWEQKLVRQSNEWEDS